MSTAISGLNTTLYCGATESALTKLCDIKDVPDMISDPNLLDATTLSDPMQKQIFGINQSVLRRLPQTTTRKITNRFRKLATMNLPKRTPTSTMQLRCRTAPASLGRVCIRLVCPALAWMRLWK